MIHAVMAVLLILVPVQRAVEDSVLHDARSVHDVALLQLDEFEVNGVSCWVVANVIKGSKSGSATVPGAYIKSETAEVVTEDAKAVLIKEGSWKSVAAARCGTSEGNYSWTEVLQKKRISVPEDFYSPFIHGGTIIFHPTPGAAGIEQFGTVRLIFPDWHKYVEPAFIFMSGHAVFQQNGHVRQSEVPRLTQLLSQDNKLLAALAFRELVASDQIKSRLARTQIRQAEVELGAIYTYVVLTSPEVSRQRLVREIAGIAKTTNDLTKLRSIALGAFAVGLFRTRDAGTISSSKSVLRAVRQRLNDLKIAVGQDPYLALIFEKMSV